MIKIYNDFNCFAVLCPTLCSGHGEYVGGKCKCHNGWKGMECQLKTGECAVPDCSGHGQCINGVCSCSKGFTGDACEICKKLFHA